MKEKILDMLYSVRSLCEILRDRPEILDKDEEIVEILDELEEHLDEWASFGSDDEVELEDDD